MELVDMYSSRSIVLAITTFLVCVCAFNSTFAQPATAPAPTAVLFENVRVFDGKSDKVSAASHVLVVDNKIQKVSSSAIVPPAGANTTRIQGGGRTLMPGLIDAHVHIMFEVLPQVLALTGDIGYINHVAAKAASELLMRGFTSARDMGGPAYGLKRAIDQGIIVGPRIWPSGAMISQSGGHGDFRLPTDLPARPGDFSHTERVNAALIADSPDEVRKRVREQLALGASQVKLHAGGGVASSYDPLDVTQYSLAEMRAATEAAENWGTYVAVHAYTPRAIRFAVEAGVKAIEHGQLLDDATAKLLADRGVWLSLQPFLDDEDAIPFPPKSASRAKQVEMISGTDNAYRLAKKYKIKTAFGTDTLFDARLAARRAMQLAKLVRWYSPAEVLRMATATNGELLALSGPRNPYPGKLGVVEEGALADLLLVDGDPLANLRLLEDPAKNLLVIVKNGQVFKNSLK
jgi:imidazolonepropionase-like amidohydrolase